MKPRLPIAHGSTRGYAQERYRGLRPCQECLAAYNARQRELYPAKRAGLVKRAPARTPAQALAVHTVVDGDHLIWTGPRPVRVRGTWYTPTRLSWAVHRSRPAEGVVRADCERAGCVHPEHIGDRRDRAAFAAVLGGAR